MLAEINRATTEPDPGERRELRENLSRPGPGQYHQMERMNDHLKQIFRNLLWKWSTEVQLISWMCERWSLVSMLLIQLTLKFYKMRIRTRKMRSLSNYASTKTRLHLWNSEKSRFTLRKWRKHLIIGKVWNLYYTEKRILWLQKSVLIQPPQNAAEKRTVSTSPSVICRSAQSNPTGGRVKPFPPSVLSCYFLFMN